MEKIFGMTLLAVDVLLAANVGAQGTMSAAVVPNTAAPRACEVPLLLRAPTQLNNQGQGRTARPVSCLAATGVVHPVTR